MLERYSYKMPLNLKPYLSLFSETLEITVEILLKFFVKQDFLEK